MLENLSQKEIINLFNILFPLFMGVVFLFLSVFAHFSWEYRWVRYCFFAVLGLYNAAFFALTGILSFVAFDFTTSGITIAQDNYFWGAMGCLVVSVLTLLILVPITRPFIFKAFPPAVPQSPPHILGAVLFVMLSVNYLLSLTIFYDKAAMLKLLKESSLEVSAVTMFVTILMIVIGGAGLLVRRGWKSTLSRLGLIKLSLKDVGMCVGFAVGMLAVLLSLDQILIRPYFPDAFAVSAEFDHAMKLVGSPEQILIGSLLIALCAGLGEEMLFRGLLQPALGLLPAAILFGLMHVHYGPSIMLIQVFCLGLLFGLIRKKYGTTGSIITHGTFDLLVLCLTGLDVFGFIQKLFQ
ncbi:MAG: CPBP family intramembrane metalloprotease [Cyanobacteria bacterium]|nr:CPBP family intramembrane metalloprotease [Cyanobacteriota bacterium]